MKIEVPASYDGPRLDDDEVKITPEWCVNMMKYMADQKKIHKKYVIKLLWKARDLLSTLLSVVEHPIPDD